MSMRTWVRKMAHEKARRNGVTKPNRERRYADGNRAGSWFANNWRQAACMDISKMNKRRKTV